MKKLLSYFYYTIAFLSMVTLSSNYISASRNPRASRLLFNNPIGRRLLTTAATQPKRPPIMPQQLSPQSHLHNARSFFTKSSPLFTQPLAQPSPQSLSPWFAQPLDDHFSQYEQPNPKSQWESSQPIPYFPALPPAATNSVESAVLPEEDNSRKYRDKILLLPAPGEDTRWNPDDLDDWAETIKQYPEFYTIWINFVEKKKNINRKHWKKYKDELLKTIPQNQSLAERLSKWWSGNN